jgi:DNA polymerase-4
MGTIFHVDMDAFFVSVEELYDPTLKGKPVVVGGRPNERGVVAAASYAARKFGVHSAMPTSKAYRLCPQAIFIEGHPERYREYSGRVYRIFQHYSPQVEMASIDEAYLDLTGCERLLGPALAAAHRLHEEVRRETDLHCSIGIGATRLVAKIASDQAKPNGILWVLPGTEPAFLAPLDVRKIPGVGPVTEKNLHELGIRKVGDLAGMESKDLEHRFGLWGLALAGKAQGEDAGGWFDTPVGAGEDAKSISHETTYNQDTADSEVLESTLAQLSQMVGRRLRESRLHGRTVQLKLRYSDFTTITRAHTLPETTQLDNVIYAAVRELFRENWRRGRKVRLLGVNVSALSRGEGQLDLLDGENKDKWRRALEAADRLRDRYGERSVGLAGGMSGGWRERVHENPAGLPGKKRTPS